MDTADDQAWPDVPPGGGRRFRCPGCEEELDVAAEVVGELVRCPYCRTDFFADDRVLGAAVVDDTPPPPPTGADAGSELNGHRVRRVLALRRGAIKARSMWVIAAVLAGAAALDLSAKAGLYLSVVGRWGLRPAGFLVAAGGFVVVVVYGLREARRFGRELATTTLPEPTEPPDFEPLGNGTERWRLLDEVR